MFTRKIKILIIVLAVLLTGTAAYATLTVYLDGTMVERVKNVMISLDGIYTFSFQNPERVYEDIQDSNLNLLQDSAIQQLRTWE